MEIFFSGIAIPTHFFGRPWILCDDTVVKLGQNTLKGSVPEALALEFVRSHTSIPVPLVRRCINHKRGYIVLEKIEGTRLDKVWPSLSGFQRFGVALTLHDYIRQLRRASFQHPRQHIPGPLDVGDDPQRCTGVNWLWPIRDRGPFASSAKFIKYLNKRYSLPKKGKDRARGTFKDSHPLVFSHMDLCLRNIIVGHDGRLWLVDFQWAGFYPPWFEQLATMSTAENDISGVDSWMLKPGGQSAAISWWSYIPFVIGSWPSEVSLHGYGTYNFPGRLSSKLELQDKLRIIDRQTEEVEVEDSVS